MLLQDAQQSNLFVPQTQPIPAVAPIVPRIPIAPGNRRDLNNATAPSIPLSPLPPPPPPMAPPIPENLTNPPNNTTTINANINLFEFLDQFKTTFGTNIDRFDNSVVNLSQTFGLLSIPINKFSEIGRAHV